MSSIQITGVCERDVDLLLLEEFVSSESFVAWFAEKLGIHEAQLVGCRRSVICSNGESDLELTLNSSGRIHKVLIENKVGASFQPRQPERYCDRASSYVRRGDCEDAKTVIIAPESYFPNDAETFGFDHRLTHETLLDWFEESEESLGSRAQYKQALLNCAINRGGAGWLLVPDKAATDFWNMYWNKAKALAAELRMPRPSEKPARSGFIRFKPVGLTNGVQILHKVRHGNVDLQFAGMGNRVPELDATFGARLPSDVRIEQAKQSAVVRRKVCRIDISAPLSESEEAVCAGLKAAMDLLTWYRKVANEVANHLK